MGSSSCPDGVPKMSPRTPNQSAKSREQALAAFVSKKAEIDAMLTRLQTLSDDHFKRWGGRRGRTAAST